MGRRATPLPLPSVFPVPCTVHQRLQFSPLCGAATTDCLIRGSSWAFGPPTLGPGHNESALHDDKMRSSYPSPSPQTRQNDTNWFFFLYIYKTEYRCEPCLASRIATRDRRRKRCSSWYATLACLRGVLPDLRAALGSGRNGLTPPWEGSEQVACWGKRQGNILAPLGLHGNCHY